eukprot:TRINITY_DN38039_c0_g1_i1.p1 TRINITY_DN38039_c0_g1~~TRINITY_DN38039_c0_g1_i1.p1  ORF type:complete len:111 (-),score=26.63 TRINITY_DN38039_c0_g1_i1:71-403(-)
MLRSLVGSEMCIRDSINAEYGAPNAHIFVTMIFKTSLLMAYFILDATLFRSDNIRRAHLHIPPSHKSTSLLTRNCLLYTSDAADEEDSVDLGGRRIIKKKKNINENKYNS